MGITLTLIDHHIIPNQKFIHNPKVKLVLGYDQDNYFENVAPYSSQLYDYVFFGENPDAIISAAMYLLSHEKKPLYKCLPRALKKADFDRLAGAGLNNIVFFNCLWAYESDLDEVESVVLINPHESGLQNISASHILYKSLQNPTHFMRDLAGIAIVMDYTLDEAFEIIVDIVNSYPEMFADLTQRIKDITLNKYNVNDSAFGEITSMVRAPSILYGVKGVDNMMKTLVRNDSFTLPSLMNDEPSENIRFFRTTYAKYKEIFDQEMGFFEKEKQVQDVVITYAPHFKSQNFVREFSNRIKDNNINSIVMVKTPTGDRRTKYSIRRGELNIDLGKTLEELGTGGGNPFAAGCTVSDPDAFEKAFLKKIEEADLTT